MAATVPSTHRGTPSLTVAPTQNSAPVHEFRCLYTRDLHKKAKKWHDGSLRFHTFNRRVMVYDDAKNYIGDLHYTQEDEFGEGVEIQLDRGVKVEVGDRLGETQTDLAPILERQRPEKTAPQPRQTAHLSTRPQSTGYSQRPKSLLEVLGPSQGRLGRSRLSLQSPYEQRQPASRPDPVPPAAKKPKLAGVEKNLTRGQGEQTTASQQRPGEQYRRRAAAAAGLPLADGRRVPVQFKEVLDISSDDEPRRPHGRDAESQSRQIEAARRLKEKTKPVPTSKKPSRNAVASATKTPRESSLNQPGVNSKVAAPQRQQPTTATAASRERTPPAATRPRPFSKGTARLLLSQPKPRSTLTCLMPFTRDAGTGCNANNVDGESDFSSLRPAPSRRSMSPDQNDSREHDRDHDSDSLIATPSSHKSARGRRGPDSHIASSPLFIPEDDTERPTSPPNLAPTQEDFFLSPLDAIQSSQGSRGHRQAPCSGFDTEESNAGRESCVTQESMVLRTHTNSPENPKDRSLPLPPRDLISVRNTDTHAFQRVFSESDALGDEDWSLAPERSGNEILRGIEARSPLKVLDNLNSRRTPVNARKSAKIQRWTSDTAALGPENDNETSPNVQERSKGEVGPWTSEEAFLLFDWWPPDKEKPEFWDHVNLGHTSNTGPPEGVPQAVQGVVRSGITTARQFLRDEINVL
ncbi:hypothetical protein ABEF95_011280 [Exophiala dermatitidis]